KVEARLGKRGAPWTGEANLPGGDFAVTDFDGQIARLREKYPFLSPAEAFRLTRLYGTTAFQILGDARQHSDLGTHFGFDLYEAEVTHLMENEWARMAEDILWRRTKRGLVLSEEQAADLAAFVEAPAKNKKKAG
ncbi:MAG: glycerol-3-phosphate dehydrogenase C-terminal domain-containing protein, partial [Pseudomonadota bacterium]